MVDPKLIKKLKALGEQGPSKPSDALLMYELVKQLAKEEGELKEEIADMEPILVQMVVSDINYKYWVKLGGGEVDYAEGDAEEPSVTMSATGATWIGLSTGSMDSTSAYMSGDLKIEGNLQDAIAFGEVLGLIRESFGDLTEGSGEEAEKPTPKAAAPKATPTPPKKEEPKKAAAPEKKAEPKKEEPKKAVDEESQIREAAYYLSKKGHTYSELCWFLAERQLKISKAGKAVEKDEIKKKAEEISNSKKKYDDLCWLIAKIDITKKL